MNRAADALLPALTSEQQAINVGYDEGKRIRANGGLPEHLGFQRDTLYEQPFPIERGTRNPLHSHWRRGFDAGYTGQPKPKA